MAMYDNKRDSEFYEFFLDELKDIYWAEQHLVDALAEMQEAATSSQLAAAFEKHGMETNEHIQIVEQVFEILGEEPKSKKCDAMAGLIKEAKKVISDTEKDSFVRDAGLIMAAQKAEHYEIATYGTLRILARFLENDSVIGLLEQILTNEKDTDVALTILAEESINAKAAVE